MDMYFVMVQHILGWVEMYLALVLDILKCIWRWSWTTIHKQVWTENVFKKLEKPVLQYAGPPSKYIYPLGMISIV